MKDFYIVGYARTAIGNYFGSLESFNPVDLGVYALKGAIQKAGIEVSLIQEVIAGQCNQSASPGPRNCPPGGMWYGGRP